MRNKVVLAVVLLFTICQGQEILQSELNRLDAELKSLKGNIKTYLNEQEDYERDDGDFALADATEPTPTCDFNGPCINFWETENDKVKWHKTLSWRNVRDASTPTGSFYAAEISKNYEKDDYAYLRSSNFKITKAKQCLEFSYFMYAHADQLCDTARLLVTMEGDDTTTELFRASSAPMRKWYRQYVSIEESVGKVFKMAFRVSKGLGTDAGTVALDDVVLHNTDCPQPGAVQSAEQIQCTFDSAGTCDWKKGGQLKWSSAVGGTRQGGTGPDKFFGYGLYGFAIGEYPYIDTRSAESKGKYATLTSPVARTATPKCMRVAVSTEGKDIGSAEITIITSSGRAQAFKQTGNKDTANGWFDTFINLPVNTDFQVELKATVGNGTKSDIAFDNVAVQDGQCNRDKPLAECKYDGGDGCNVMDETCGEEIDGFEIKDEFQPTENNIVTVIPKISKEWSVSIEIKPLQKVNGWTNILHMSSTGSNCCNKGDRVPLIKFFSNSFRCHITNAVGNSGNWAENGITLKQNVYNKLKLQQIKDGSGNYKFNIYLDDKLRKSVQNTKPREWRNVKVYLSDVWHRASFVKVRNFAFKNEGAFDECNALCNKPLSDPAFNNLPIPPPARKTAEFSPVKGSEPLVIGTVEKEWEFSMDIKPIKKVRGWGGIVHNTNGKGRNQGNCCDRGNRVPGIWFFSNSYKLHITSQNGWSGNYAYNNILLEENKWANLKINQKKEDGKYIYRIYKDGKVEHEKINTRPEVFDDMKLYTNSKWYNSANVKIKNLEFKNLIATYPCSSLCKGKAAQETIEGKQVSTFTYDLSTCRERDFNAEVSIPKRMLRYGCLTLQYKIGPSQDTNMHCHLGIYNGNRRLLSLSGNQSKNINKWTTVQYSIDRYEPTVGMKGYINSRCSNVAIGTLKVMEGLCPKA